MWDEKISCIDFLKTEFLYLRWKNFLYCFFFNQNFYMWGKKFHVWYDVKLRDFMLSLSKNATLGFHYMSIPKVTITLSIEIPVIWSCEKQSVNIHTYIYIWPQSWSPSTWSTTWLHSRKHCERCHSRKACHVLSKISNLVAF